MPLAPSDLESLIETVREAGALAQSARSKMDRELKKDGSIVTAGDRAVESFLRERLAPLVPGAGFFGEELGNEGDQPAGLWAIDPIDGTSNYAFGSPLWGVTVALLEGGRLTAGVIDLPDLAETYSASLGGGAWCNGASLPPIPNGPIESIEMVSINDHVLKGSPGTAWPGKMRCSGAFVIDAMWVAQQRFRAMVGTRGKLYDIAASVLINQELGADVRYLDGSELNLTELMAGATLARPYAIAPRGSGLIAD